MDHELAFQLEPDWRPVRASRLAPNICVPHNDMCSSYSAWSSYPVEVQQGGLAHQYAFERDTRQLRSILREIQRIENMELKELIEKEELKRHPIMPVPHGVYGFVLRTRKWAHLDIDNLKDVRDISSFEQLVIPERHKTIVKSMVRTHSGGMDAQKKVEQPYTLSHMDFVSGKGKISSLSL